MVAYSYQARFAEPILAGTKTQTIRGPRKRHARPGEMIQHYTGLRTRYARKIRPDTRCEGVAPVILVFAWSLGGDLRPSLWAVEVDGVAVTDLDAFAIRDGFQDRHDLAHFWAAHHGAIPRFEGVLISWEARP